VLSTSFEAGYQPGNEQKNKGFGLKPNPFLLPSI
jgi:hypothetical protein